jgi:predicted nucleotidyltransferase component of viral defense system
MKIVAQNVNDFGIVLKDGAALMLCYDLDRFSEDLDFDSYSDKFNFDRFQRSLMKLLITNSQRLERINVKRDTENSKKLMLKYSQVDNASEYPLKIEFSLRNRDIIKDSDYHIINGICVYKIKNITIKKLDDFKNRTSCADIYDIAFLLKKYPSVFNLEMLNVIKKKDPGSLLTAFKNDKASDSFLHKIDETNLILEMLDKIKKIESLLAI